METNSNNLSAYDKVLLARKNTRTGISFVQNIFDDFVELCGDRRFGDDKAVIAGIASLCGQPVTVIAQEKGRDTKEKLVRGFGCAHPEGYRKALRQMKIAEKFHRPVICFVDTAGAFCGIQAEQRGQAQAIAENLYEMSTLKTPIITVLIGEGGSGGALGLAAGDRVWMLENSVYSVISPEGCASILWKDAGKADYAAQCLKLTAQDLLRLNVAERIFPDTSDEELYSMLKTELFAEIKKLLQMPIPKLLAERYEKFRKIV